LESSPPPKIQGRDARDTTRPNARARPARVKCRRRGHAALSPRGWGRSGRAGGRRGSGGAAGGAAGVATSSLPEPLALGAAAAHDAPAASPALPLALGCHGRQRRQRPRCPGLLAANAARAQGQPQRAVGRRFGAVGCNVDGSDGPRAARSSSAAANAATRRPPPPPLRRRKAANPPPPPCRQRIKNPRDIFCRTLSPPPSSPSTPTAPRPRSSSSVC
jgi:hypothetical protein